MTDRDKAVRELVEGFLGLSDCVTMRGHEATAEEIESRLRTFVAELAAERDRALGELGQMREATQELIVGAMILSKRHDEDRGTDGFLEPEIEKARASLAASPLSGRAGEVFALVKEAAGFECEYGVPCCEEEGGPTMNCWPCRARLALGALRTELAREGSEG